MGISVAYNQGILKAHAKNYDYAFRRVSGNMQIRKSVI